MKPNWGKWSHMRNVEIWQAVSLSLNIEPARIEQFRHWTAPGMQVFGNVPEEFRDRLDVVIGRFHDIEPGRTLRLRPEPNYHVSLPRFIEFSRKVKWEYPSELDAVLEASKDEESQKAAASMAKCAEKQDDETEGIASEDALHLKRVIGALALTLVEAKGAGLIHGDRPNVKAIAREVDTVLQGLSGVSLRGLGDTSLRTIIGQSIAALESVRDVPDN